jgi:RimJ/RimL family protein N-acetyltransferase
VTGGRLRPADEPDRDRVLRWRNHPQVRAVSLTRHAIGEAEHRAWWQAALADPDRQVLIYEHDGEPAGVVIVVGLAAEERHLQWSFHLDVDGLARRDALLRAWMGLERATVAHAFDTLDAASLGGETLASNTPVLDLHRRFGFRELRRYPRTVDGAEQQVVWTEMSRSEVVR